MKLFLKILGVLAVLLVVLCLFIASRPDEFKVTRSAVIDAPPTVVFEKVDNLQNWNSWSPWAPLDPDAKYAFSGPEAGVGATFAWAGNEQVGEGKMTITESKPLEFVGFHMEFYKPFPGTSETEFTFRPEGNGTLVTWTMTGRNNFVAKAVGLFMDCDKIVGTYFEEGLANLNRVASAQTAN